MEIRVKRDRRFREAILSSDLSKTILSYSAAKVTEKSIRLAFRETKVRVKYSLTVVRVAEGLSKKTEREKEDLSS